MKNSFYGARGKYELFKLQSTIKRSLISLQVITLEKKDNHFLHVRNYSIY